MQTENASQIHAPTTPKKVQILPPLVAERIAAGEVIERPASVVKELVENSIDAGATQIEVRLQKGGCELIEVTDNGSGMQVEDLELSVCRHATSKITAFEDLSNLSSLGFRGEALPSIAAVACLKITTKAKSTDSAESAGTFEVVAEHTAPKKAESRRVPNYNFVGSNHGTRITVTSLFSQIPARLKFLKSAGAETSAVREIIERIALTHPEVAFTLTSDERKIVSLPSETLAKRAERMLSNNNPFEVLHAKLDGAWSVEVIWLKGLSQPHTRSIYQIVNGRALRDRIVQQAVLNPLRQSFLPGHFPSMVVKLDIPADEIDVNAHPTKTEIRFLDSKKIFALCHAAIEKLLADSTPTAEELSQVLNPIYSKGAYPHFEQQQSFKTDTSSMAYTKPEQFQLGTQDFGGGSLSAGGNANFTATPTKQESFFGANQFESSHNGDQHHSHSHFHSPTHASTEENQDHTTSATPFTFDTTPFGLYKGIWFSTYIVFEQDEEMLLIDQHAAHERIRYEKLKSRVLKEEGVEEQTLLVPEVIRMDAEKLFQMKEKLQLLKSLGFDCEAFSEESVLFRSIPAVWGMSQLTPRLKNLLERLHDSEVSGIEMNHPVWDETLFEKVAMEACRSSFKAGDHMNEWSAIDLTRKLMQCQHPGNCPHGRVTFIKISKLKIEEWFNRKI
jgi:DNA mismatch repair protein MutL